MSPAEVFDFQEALDRCRGKRELLAELARIFLADAVKQGAALDAACAALSLEEIERAAHRLKGSAANLSLHRTVAVAERMEELARHEEPAAAAALLPELRVEMREAAQSLNALLAAS